MCAACKYVWIWMRFRARNHEKPSGLRFASCGLFCAVCCGLCCGICCVLCPAASMPRRRAQQANCNAQAAAIRPHGFSLLAAPLFLPCCTQVKLLETRCGLRQTDKGWAGFQSFRYTIIYLYVRYKTMQSAIGEETIYSYNTGDTELTLTTIILITLSNPVTLRDTLTKNNRHISHFCTTTVLHFVFLHCGFSELWHSALWHSALWLFCTVSTDQINMSPQI